MKQYEVLNWAFSCLEKYQREQNVAHVLLMHFLKLERNAFYVNMRESIDPDIIKQFKAAILEHAISGKPVQHISGYEYFYGRKFIVNQDVLIPRPETEELVEFIINHCRKYYGKEKIRIVDLGTGSGIIAITLAAELPNSTVLATDISEKALDIARENAEKLQVDVQFMQGDFLQPLIDYQINPHMIVSNPPYIASKEKTEMSDTVVNFDPHLALFAENNGLAAYERILNQVKELPDCNGRQLCFEIGYQQGEDVSRLINRELLTNTVQVIDDINGKNRIVTAKLI